MYMIMKSILIFCLIIASDLGVAENSDDVVDSEPYDRIERQADYGTGLGGPLAADSLPPSIAPASGEPATDAIVTNPCSGSNGCKFNMKSQQKLSKVQNGDNKLLDVISCQNIEGCQKACDKAQCNYYTIATTGKGIVAYLYNLVESGSTYAQSEVFDSVTKNCGNKRNKRDLVGIRRASHGSGEIHQMEPSPTPSHRPHTSGSNGTSANATKHPHTSGSHEKSTKRPQYNHTNNASSGGTPANPNPTKRPHNDNDHSRGTGGTPANPTPTKHPHTRGTAGSGGTPANPTKRPHTTPLKHPSTSRKPIPRSRERSANPSGTSANPPKATQANPGTSDQSPSFGHNQAPAKSLHGARPLGSLAQANPVQTVANAKPVQTVGQAKPVRTVSQTKPARTTFHRNFRKTFKSSAEREKHEHDFKANLLRMDDLNTKNRKNPDDAACGLNYFSDEDSKMFPTKFGGAQVNPKVDVAEHVEWSEKEDLKIMSKSDWREQNVIPPIRYQGSCGACYAFASADLIAAQNAIERGPKSGKSADEHSVDPLSPQYLMDCTTPEAADGCKGGRPIKILESVASDNSKDGVPLEACMKYEGAPHGQCSSESCCQRSKIQKSKMLDISGPDEKTLMASLLTNGPVLVIVNVNEVWQFYNGTGVIKAHQCDPENRNHALVIVGHDYSGPTPYYIVKNSWSTSWGIQGYAKLEAGTNACGVAKNAITTCVRNCQEWDILKRNNLQ